ncbi:unnamed protein product [Polarella glacialis]|uniref:BACK domain-containing protein n=2 Tax=Polarella glacialis TaxID=89957 RepID=A0A813K800_POLGL|nr:unnamed protein product [Polarella glacialis]
MIGALATECSRYMREDVIGATDILTVMTSSLKHGYSLPEDPARYYWSTIVADSNSALQSPAFLLADHRIIQKLVQLDEFGVAEDLLWSRLLQWAASTEQKPELVSSLLGSESEGQERKRRRGDESLEPAEPSSHKFLVLREFIQHLRFPLMSKAIFVTEAAKYLSREEERSVTTFHLLGCKPQFSTSERICGPCSRALPISMCTTSDAPHEATRLLHGTATWTCRIKHAATYNQLTFELPKSHLPMIVSALHLTYANPTGDFTSTFQLQAVFGSSRKSSGRPLLTERFLKSNTVWVTGLPPARKWKLEFQTPIESDAKLAGLRVMGIDSQDAWAKSVVDRRASQLFRAPDAAIVEGRS